MRTTTEQRTFRSFHRIDRARLDEGRRSVAVSFSSEAPVRDRAWGPPVVLLHEARSADLDRATSALLNHDPNHIIGRVDDAHIDMLDRRGRARITFDDDEDGNRAMRKVKSGSLAGVSVSYRALEGRELDQDEEWTSAEGRTFTGPASIATRWEPVEISLTPIPADSTVGVGRSRQRTGDMPQDDRNDPTTQLDQPGGTAVAERQRISELRRIARQGRMPEETVDGWIETGTTVDQARAQALEHWHNTNPPVGQTQSVEVGRGAEERWNDAHVAGMLERLDLLRAEDFPRHTQPARLSLAEIGRHCLRRAGVSDADRLSPSEIAQRAFYHSTSDFANILENTATKAIAVAFREAPSTYSAWVKEGSANKIDVDVSRLSFSEAPDVELNVELMPISDGTFTDGKEVVRIKTYGKRFSISRNAVINDDLGVLSDIPVLFSQSVRRKIDDLVYTDTLVANPTLSGDSTAVFHANHSNLETGAGSALDSAALSAARKAMRLQTGPAGAFLNIMPRYLLVPPSLETTAEELINSLVKPDGSTAANTLNIFSRGGLDVITEPRLESDSTTRWYLLSGKSQAAIEVLYLNDNRTPILTRETGQTTVLGAAWTVFFDVGVGAIDYRGAVRNEGS